MRRYVLAVLVLAALVALAILFLAFPLAAGEPQEPAAPESDWGNLQRLPLGAPLVIEQTSGKELKGRFHSIADDAISVVKGKTVVGVARPQVQRIWLLGDTKTRKGALLGLLVGGLGGGTLTGAVCAAETTDISCAFAGLVYGAIFGGAGAGVGAAIGANVRERTLMYRAPPPSAPDSGKPLAAVEAAGGGKPLLYPVHAGAVDSLPGPLREVYRAFSSEQAAQEVARELAQASPAGASPGKERTQ